MEHFKCPTQVLFDHVGSLKKYESVQEILKDFFELRMKYYVLRKDWLLGMLGAEAARLTNQARFILEKIEGKLVIGECPPPAARRQIGFSGRCKRMSQAVQSHFYLTSTNLTLSSRSREQTKEGADPHAAADGIRLRPCQGLEAGSGEGE